MGSLLENVNVQWVSFDPGYVDLIFDISITQSAGHFSKHIGAQPELDFGTFHFFDIGWHLIASILKRLDQLNWC